MTGADIKALRKRLGMTQTQFAEQIGTNRHQITRWERGYQNPGKMAQLLIKHLQERVDKTTD